MSRLIRSWWALAALGLACALAWSAALSLPDDDVHIYFFDVGEGDAILIRTPHYKVLVDGGPSGQEISRHLGRVLPFWDRRIDLMVSTHGHEDHLAGLVEVARRYEVGAILASPYEHESAVNAEWKAVIREKAVPLLAARLGQEIQLGRQARLDVLHPGERLLGGTASDPNNNSVVLRATFGALSVLLAGDVGEAGEKELVARQNELASLVVKIPHQGARDSVGETFLQRVRPGVAIISTGKDNSFGHPDPLTLERLKIAQVYRTDLDGTIEIRTDGRVYTVRTSRPVP